MSVSRQTRLKYHRDAYRFIFEALQFTQEKLKRVSRGGTEDDAHISGQELMEGVRELPLKKFGLLAITVFHHWGVRATDDFGRIVFELIERAARCGRPTATSWPTSLRSTTLSRPSTGSTSFLFRTRSGRRSRPPRPERFGFFALGLLATAGWGRAA